MAWHLTVAAIVERAGRFLVVEEKAFRTDDDVAEAGAGRDGDLVRLAAALWAAL